MRTSITQLRKADWNTIEKEVLVKIRLLRAMCEKLEPNELNDKIANDLILPAMACLGNFCTSVELDEFSLDKTPQ